MSSDEDLGKDTGQNTGKRKIHRNRTMACWPLMFQSWDRGPNLHWEAASLSPSLAFSFFLPREPSGVQKRLGEINGTATDF